MFSTILDFFGDHPESPLKLVRLTNYDEPTARIFTKEFDERFKPVDPKNFDDILDDAEVDMERLRATLRESSDEESLEVRIPKRFGENGEEEDSSSADSLEGGYYVHRSSRPDNDYPDEEGNSEVDEDSFMNRNDSSDDDDDDFL